jgi:hypothetical protein
MLDETVERFKNLYLNKKETIDYMERFGNDYEKLQARIIKNVALGN